MRIRIQLVHLSLAAGFIVALVAIVVITALGANRLNTQSLEMQRTTAHFEIHETYEYLRGQVRQMVYWQDTFDHSVRRWDQTWMAYQFGQYQETMGNHFVVIIDRAGRVRYLHAPDHEVAFNTASFVHAAGLEALLNPLWVAGAQQPPLMPGGIVVVGGKPYAAAASLVTPENKADLASASRTPLAAVFLRPVTVALFAELSATSKPDQIHIALAGEPAPGLHQFALTDARGKTLGWLRWRPRLPGDDFTHQITVPLMIVLAIFMLIQVIVVGRWLALQRTMLRAQAEARAAQEQSRLKSVFLGTISHELRTPLNAVIGYADVLCCQIFGPLGNPRNSEYVHDIRTSGRHLLNIVDDLIEIARIEAHNTGGGDDIVDAANAVRQAINALQPPIQEKALRVSLIHSERPAICRGSLISLAQAIERILSNAVRHSPGGAAIAIALLNDGRTVDIEIRDHGEGIAPDRLDDLTRPFGHPDNHLVAGKGLGFGIPIAKGLVQLMGGSLRIDSTPGAGTTVHLILPADDRKPAEAPAASSHAVFRAPKVRANSPARRC